MKKVFLMITLGLILLSLSFISASELPASPFPVNKAMNITGFCSTNDCTYAYIKTITSPSGIIEDLNNTLMNKNENGETFYYSYTPTETGTYTVVTCPDPLSKGSCETDTFVSESRGNSVFGLTLNSIGNYIALGILLVVFVTMLFFKRFDFAGATLIFADLLEFFNGLNIVVALLVLAGGIIILFLGGDD